MAGIKIKNPDTGTSFFIRENEVNLPQYKGYVTSDGIYLTGGSIGSAPSSNSPTVEDLTGQMQNYYNQLAEAEARAKRQALLGAYQTQRQALGSQRSDVETNYQSLLNRLNTTKENMLPQYQQQRNLASADAASQLKRTQVLNALTGKYHSGANRSQQLAVDLAKQGAIQGRNLAENQFAGDIANRLTEAESQRVAALNDIAEKLSLLDRQYSEGTLSLENQLASQKAAYASKAYIDAIDQVNRIEQQGVDLSLRERQLLIDEMVKKAEIDYRNRALEQDDRHFWAGLNSGGSPRGAGLNEQAFASAMQGLEGLASGSIDGKRYSRSEILNFILQNASDFAANGVDVEKLYDWASKKYTWEKDSSGKWYDTSEI